MTARPPYTINFTEKSYLVFEDLLSYTIWFGDI